MSSVPVVMTIAGSDSCGGAGIQADLKTFAAFGVHGASIITAITAQNTRGVENRFVLPAEQISAQLESVLSDVPIDAVKIGMLGSAECVSIVAATLRRHRFKHVILDPVMVATSGDRLLDVAAIELLRSELLPLASLLTPNVAEAESLLGRRLHSQADMQDVAQDLRRLGCAAVLLKGAHIAGNEVEDWYVDAEQSLCFRHPRLAVEGHGTGCTLASAVAAGLAQGQPLEQAMNAAIDYVQRGLQQAFYPGRGIALLGNMRLS